MELRGKTAFISGAASGLGLATAKRFIAEGAQVLLFDLNEEGLRGVSQELGAQAAWAAGDVSDEQQVQQGVEKALSSFGAVHVDVNCAGIGIAAKTVGRDGPMALAAYQRVISVNLIGTFNVLRLCAEAMQKNDPQGEDGERGVIINVASAAAYDGQMGQAAYSASKGGIAAMTLPVARDLASTGIRVMTIAPGLFETPMMSAAPEQVRTALLDMIQFPKRMGEPEEFADVAAHIVRCAYLNGEVIRLDGAMRMSAR